MKNFIIKTNYSNIINYLKSYWPLNITELKNSVKIETGHERREIWAFPIIGGCDYIDDAIHSMEEHRKVIPAALYRSAEKINGIFFAGYYAKKIKEKEYEHGLVIIPANRNSIDANSKLLTDFCFQRNELYSKMFSEDYFKQVNSFLNCYKDVCKKYWIQDTKILNTEFVERPKYISEEEFCCHPATSTWHTEVYPDFMRPLSMIGDIYFDFMLCDHNLVYLQSEFDYEDSIWDFFEEEGIKDFYSMPSETTLNTEVPIFKGWVETTDFELSERQDLDYKTHYDISVPGLKGTIINQGYSIGWCGKVAFMGVSLDKPLYITPTLLKDISEISDFEQTGNDNKAFWRNRDIEYRRRFGPHNIIKVCDDLITIKNAKENLLEACDSIMKYCKKPLNPVQKGINKFVLRYLKGLARGPEEEKASDFINRLNNAQICADEQEVLDQIIKWIKIY